MRLWRGKTLLYIKTMRLRRSRQGFYINYGMYIP
jgi:hypothetical protein